MRWPDSPFQVGYDIDDDFYFFNRKNELKEIREGLRRTSGRIWQIAGPRRIGKTSLLRKCYRDFSGSTSVALLNFLSVRFYKEDGNAIVKRTRAEIVDEILRDISVQWAKAVGHVLSPIEGTLDIGGFIKLVQELRTKASALPFILLVDEIEVARISNPWVLDDLLEAILACGASRVRAVLSEGRQLGQNPSRYLAARLGGKLKDVPRTDVKPFALELVGPLLNSQVKQYSYSSDAIEAVLDLTNGHPLFFCALNDYLYSCRKDRLDSSEMLGPEVYGAAPKLVPVINNQFEWLWQEMSPVQNHLARVIADLTWDDSQARFCGTLPFDRIVAELRSRAVVNSRDEVTRAAETLRSNYVLFKDLTDLGWRLFAPLLGYWILSLCG